LFSDLTENGASQHKLQYVDAIITYLHKIDVIYAAAYKAACEPKARPTAMIEKPAETSVPLHEPLAQRWSPRAFADRPVEPDKLRALFEAARWAASTNNFQPWSFIVAQRNDRPAFDRMLACLLPGNQSWAQVAPVLILTFFRPNRPGEDKVLRTAMHDLGMATAMLSVQAEAMGLRTHHMGGIDHDKIRTVYGVPADVEPATGIAVGYQGDASVLPEEKDRAREGNPRTRKPLGEVVFAGTYGAAAAFD
jgi:nitroreductase